MITGSGNWPWIFNAYAYDLIAFYFISFHPLWLAVGVLVWGANGMGNHNLVSVTKYRTGHRCTCVPMPGFFLGSPTEPITFKVSNLYFCT
jgi:hypothetical protein